MVLVSLPILRFSAGRDGSTLSNFGNSKEYVVKRRVFYSFHYEPDSWRASMVRNIGVIEGSRPATDNDWETVKQGTNTAGRKWINHEIIKS